MKKQLFTTITQTPKKELILTGTLSLPLKVGERAWIHVQNQTITTSVVKQIMEVSETGIVFETCNSIYRLDYARLPMCHGVMCA